MTNIVHPKDIIDDFGLENTFIKNTKKYLVFILDALYYAIDIEFVSEIITSFAITPIPRVPDYIKGVFNLRGQIVPVVDIRARLGLAKLEYTNTTCIIVIEVNSETFGIIVDEVSHVVDINPNKISVPPINHSTNKLVSGIVREETRVFLIFDGSMLVV